MPKNGRPKFTEEQLEKIKSGIYKRYIRKKYRENEADVMTELIMKALKSGKPNAMLPDAKMSRVRKWADYNNEDKTIFRATRALIYRLLGFDD